MPPFALRLKAALHCLAGSGVVFNVHIVGQGVGAVDIHAHDVALYVANTQSDTDVSMSLTMNGVTGAPTEAPGR